MFRSIVVPLDGSAQANTALPLARSVARATGAEITLVRVMPDGVPHADAVARMNRMASELAEDDLHVKAVVRAGDPATEILEVVRAQSADLVVVRTHGRSGLARAVLGSVTERILAAALAPVLLVRPGGRWVSRLRSVLVPVDGSPGGALALGTAIRLARTTGAALRLVEVVVPIPYYLYSTGIVNGMMYVDPAWDTEAEMAARTYIDALTKRLSATGLSATGDVAVAGSIADQIVRSADEPPADLIVMSSEWLTGAPRAILGSVADAVVRSAHCPVLVIHRPHPDEVAPIASPADAAALVALPV